MRDRYGITQVVVGPPEASEALIDAAGHVGNESVILIRGVVADRLEGKVNAKLATGEIEVRSEHFEILSVAQTPPFTPGQSDLPGEDLRLKYRYLDLRRKEMQQALIRRSEIISAVVGTPS